MKTSRHYASRIFYSTLALCALFASGALFAQSTLVLPDGDYPHDIYLTEQLTIHVAGSATISGRITSATTTDGLPAGGAFIKTGNGTLTITGSDNFFLGPNTVASGTLAITHVGALGTGNIEVSPGAAFVMRDIRNGDSFSQAITGGGRVEVTDCDMTLEYRHPYIIGATAEINFSQLVVTRSCLFVVATGTLSTGLGGASVYVRVTEGSTLVLGREGLPAHGSDATKIPITYAILANRIDLSGGSSLVLNPNAHLSAGALIVADNSTCAISFGDEGVSRLRWQEGIDPDSIFFAPNAPNIPKGVRYIVPDGMKLIIDQVAVPVSAQQSIPADTSSSGWCREYVVYNPNSINIQPVSQTVTAGQNAFFNVTSIDTPAMVTLSLDYPRIVQWQSSPDGNTWTDIRRATSATLTLNAVTTAMNGTLYRCVTTSYFFESPDTPISLTSNVVMLTVNAGGGDGGNEGGNSGNGGNNNGGEGGGGGAPSLLWLGAVAAMVALRKKAK